MISVLCSTPSLAHVKPRPRVGALAASPAVGGVKKRLRGRGMGLGSSSSNLVGRDTADRRPVDPEAARGSTPSNNSPPGSPPSSSSLLEQSVGGAVNNVATRKINCVQAAGLGGAFGGPAEAPGL